VYFRAIEIKEVYFFYKERIIITGKIKLIDIKNKEDSDDFKSQI
jgi:hypothetical protein